MLNEEGLLPEGVCDLTLDEARRLFGTFNGNDRRPRLFDRLADYIEQLSNRIWYRGLFVDGSFVTSKEKPNDIDLILVVDLAQLDEESLPPVERNLLSHRQVQKKYGFDLMVAGDGSVELDQYVDYFSQVRGSDLRKGIVRLIE